MKIYNSLKNFKRDYSMLKVAFDSGFNSLEYFSELFKKTMGVSPITYKKFISYDVRISEKDVSTIMNSLVNIESLRMFVDMYKRRVKPSIAPIKKLSL